MDFIIGLILGAIVGGVIGILIYRNNKLVIDSILDDIIDRNF